MPKPIIDDLRKQNERTPVEDISKLLPEKLENRTNVATSIAELINKQRSTDALYTLSQLDNFLEFHIHNNGGREALDLKLELPVKGHFILSRRGEKPIAGAFEQVIAIGNIRPTNTVSIQVWTSDYFSEYSTDEVKVTYPDGAVGIDFPVQVRGGYAWLYNNQGVLVFLTLAALIILGGLTLAYLQYQQNNKVNAAAPETLDPKSPTSSDAEA